MPERAGRSVWSPEALADVEEIWNYCERIAGRNTAERIARDIGKAITTIEDYPFAGRPRPEVRPTFRSFAVKPHVIFYRVSNESPQIIRIVDGRRDIDDIFTLYD